LAAEITSAEDKLKTYAKHFAFKFSVFPPDEVLGEKNPENAFPPPKSG
jgi:hypothetical protein